jgi:hypothetical protein
MPCIATRALATAEDVEATFRHIEHVLEVRRIEPGRCRACGLIVAVALVKRPRP